MRRFIVPLCLSLLASTAALAVGASASTASMPTASGTFGQSPTITFPAGKPPSVFEEKVLHLGSGPIVRKGELVVVNYLGQIWNGKVFDASYARHQAAAFPIGTGAVIPGWDKGVVGAHVGSRLLLVLPPAEGYGSSGNSQAGIKGTDTLVFVIDVIGAYDKSVGGDPTATIEHNSVPGIVVSGKLGRAPVVTVAKATPKPTKETTTVIARGDGAPVTPGLLVLQVVADDWTGKVVQSTWQSGTPDSESVGTPSQPSALDPLIGVPVGSRVLIELPASGSQGPYAVAVDIVAEPSRTSTSK